MSLYSHAGVSSLNGEMKVRFCNDAFRTKVLQKNGHKDIDIIGLSEPMTKEAAVAFLISINFANKDGKVNKSVQAALEAAADKRGVTKAVAKSKPAAKGVMKPKAVKTPQVKAIKGTSPLGITPAVQTEAQAIAAVKDDLEDAPF
jgi:hypothetical protein